MVEVHVQSGQLTRYVNELLKDKGGPIQKITPISEDRALVEFERDNGKFFSILI